uniref:Uncharacterized protein n=1 Tax=Erpetoichthys calabaricus TaxID=27687 RepID=A0A8C4RXN4_ERPCA
ESCFNAVLMGTYYKMSFLRDAERKVCFTTALFEDVACLIYNCLDWRRQHKNYLNNMKLINVPAVSKPEIPNTGAQTPGKKKVVEEEPSTPPPPSLTNEVDMRYYADLLNSIPPENVTVAVILHCMLEQVVATEEEIPPLSEVIPEPRADGLDHKVVDYMMSSILSLAISDEDKKVLYFHILFYFGINKQLYKKEEKYPKLVNFHDEITRRWHKIQSQGELDPMKIEKQMLRKLPVSQFLHNLPLSPMENKKRLATLQELFNFFTSESISWSQVERILSQFVFESMKLTEVDSTGRLIKNASNAPGSIPWDDPSGYIQEIRNYVLKLTTFYKLKKIFCPL